MRLPSLLGVILLSSQVTTGQVPSEASALYFGQVPPEDSPAVFAPGVISKEDRFEQFLLFSPDGRELSFGVTNSDWVAIA